MVLERLLNVRGRRQGGRYSAIADFTGKRLDTLVEA